MKTRTTIRINSYEYTADIQLTTPNFFVDPETGAHTRTKNLRVVEGCKIQIQYLEKKIGSLDLTSTTSKPKNHL